MYTEPIVFRVCKYYMAIYYTIIQSPHSLKYTWQQELTVICIVVPKHLVIIKRGVDPPSKSDDHCMYGVDLVVNVKREWRYACMPT